MTDVAARLQETVVRVPAHLLGQGRSHLRVHAARWHRDSDAPVHVCVHGLGGTHLNWLLLGSRLGRDATVWAPDLPGFGLTPPQGRSASVEASVDALRGFVATVSPHRPVILLGNSMGGLLACTLAGREPDLVAGLVLLGPAVPPVAGWPDPRVVARFLVTSAPGVGRAWLARRERWLTPAEQAREAIEVCTSAPDDLDGTYVRALVDMYSRRRRMPHARPALIAATRSLVRRIGPGRRRLWADLDGITAPTLVLQGGRDRLTEEPGVSRFTERRPAWDYRVYTDLGHLVMIEDPDRVAADVTAWRRAAVTGAAEMASA